MGCQPQFKGFSDHVRSQVRSEPASHRAELVVDARDMAHCRAGLEPVCVIHSDRDSEGGFNWSSQHLCELEVCGWVAGSAAGGEGVSRADALAGSAERRVA